MTWLNFAPRTPSGGDTLPTWLNWKRALGLIGALGVLVAVAALTRRSGSGCGALILGRWSTPYFAIVALIGLGGGFLLLVAIFASEPTARRVGQNVLTGGLSLALTLGVVDVVMRLTPPPYARARQNYANHDTLGYFFSPHTRIEINSSPLDEYQQVSFTDANGFIVRDGHSASRPDARRIMFLGDSILAGLQVAPELNLSVKTTEYLESATGEDYQGFNLGVPGYSSLQYLLAYRTYAPDLDPHLVVVLLYTPNDFTGTTRLILDDRVIYDENGQPIAIEPQKDYERGVMWTDHSGTVPFEEVRPRLVSEEIWHRGILSVFRELAMAPICRELEWAQFEPVVYESDTLPLDAFEDGSSLECRDMSGRLTKLCTNYVIRNESLIRNNQDAIFKEMYTELDWVDIEYTLDVLRRLQRVVSADGRDLLLVVVPMHNQVPRQGEGMKPLHGVQPGEIITSTAPQDLLRDFCQAEGLDCIDLLPVFLEHSDEQLYWAYDFHFTPRGNELVAQTIVEHLLTER